MIIESLKLFIPRNKLFRDKVFNYLDSELKVSIPNKGEFYLIIDNIDESISLFFYEISISFSLELVNKKQSLPSIHKIKLKRKKLDHESYSLEISPDKIHHGQQRFLFTFTSRNGFKENQNNLFKFISETYESEDKIAERNYEFWTILRNEPVSKETQTHMRSLNVQKESFSHIESDENRVLKINILVNGFRVIFTLAGAYFIIFFIPLWVERLSEIIELKALKASIEIIIKLIQIITIVALSGLEIKKFIDISVEKLFGGRKSKFLTKR